MLKKGVFNSFRIALLVCLMLVGLLVGSRVIFSEDVSIQAAAPADGGSLNWANFDFSGLPYATNGDGKFDRFVNCSNPTYSSVCAPTWDLRATWVTQDSNFLAWKITGKDFTNASFCSGDSNLTFEIEFDADGNENTGCSGPKGDPCYPGSDYHIVVNSTGNGTLQIYNSSSLLSGCPAGNCFNLSSNVSVYVNITKYSNGTCYENPSTLRVAINKSQLKWSVLTYNVVSKQTFPVDLLGANRQEFDSVGFGGGNFFEREGNSSFMFREEGCGQFTNQSYCADGALNGNFSCVWESDFNHCRPNFVDTGNYGCSDFCGSCTTEGDCNSGARNTCKWIGSSGPCVEDFEKFRYGGNCDDTCKDCFNQNACTNSRSSGGCVWMTDPVSSTSFCGETGTSIKSCGANSETSSCSNCNSIGCISVANGGACAWENVSNFCYLNVANTEYSCFDGADNNGNNLTDCADPYCFSDNYCGGGEFEKKMLTDRNFINQMKSFGICTETSSGLSCNKEQAKLFDSMRNMDEKPGQPMKLKDDTDLTREPASSPWINIFGFGFKDMGKAFGMGIMLQNGSASAACGSNGTNSNGTGVYYYFLDTDGITSTGCWDVINNTNVTGIEYKFVYNISMLANGSASVERRLAYRCLVQNSTSFGLYPAKLSTPANPFNPSQAPICMFGASILVVPLTDIGNPSTSVVYHIATTDNSTNVSGANDTLFNATYTPGAVDFIPNDCEKNPFACGTAFAKLGGGRFVPFEDCGIGSGDEDQDGTANCADTDCLEAPWCGYNRASLMANDKTAPRILANLIDEFDTFAMLRQTTSEPSNLSVEFYNTSGTCLVSLANLTDTVGLISFDRYRPWHSINFDNKSISDSSMTPLLANSTYYYRTKNCDLSGNCAISACLNFTTRTNGVTNFNFGVLFDPKGGSSMSGLNLTYFNGSEYIHFSIRNISFISNTSMRFDNPNASFNNSIRPWNIEFEGVDLAKATSINMTDMIQFTQINESTATRPTDTRMLVGMNGTKWQEMAQLLGIDSIVLNISQVGNQIIKCDLNGSGCIDITPNITVLYRGVNYTTIRVPTYGLGGFSAYGVNNTGVYIKSDRSSYQCYPSCTVYFNVTTYQTNMSGPFDIIVSLNDSSYKASYNISYANLSNMLNWLPAPANNLTNLSNYNFTIFNSARENYTVHQFKVEINMTEAVAEKVTFNFTLANSSPVSSFTDTIWFDTISLADGSNALFSSQTPNISMTLYSLNQTNQSCSLRINGTTTSNYTINATRTWFAVNGTLANGTYNYNFSCTNSNSGETGNSTIGTIRISDVTPPLFNNSPSASSTTSSGATITWQNNERTNTTLSRGTSSASFSTNHTETGFLITHSIDISSLSASTTYYYNITSCDNVGNCNTTGPLSFTTSAASSSSSSSSSGGGGGGGGGSATVNLDKASRVWGTLAAGTNTMNIVKASIAMRKIILETTTASDSVSIDVIKLNNTPSVGSAPGTTYQYIQIDATNLNSAGLKAATIEFTVERKWLTSNNLIKDNIVLYRYSGGKWNPLSTSISGEDTINVNFKAVTPGFSVFAISGTGSGQSSSVPSVNVTASNATGNATSGSTSGSGQVNQSDVSKGNETEKPSLLSNFETIGGIPMVNLIAYAIVGLSVIGVIIYFLSRKINRNQP